MCPVLLQLSHFSQSTLPGGPSSLEVLDGEAYCHWIFLEYFSVISGMQPSLNNDSSIFYFFLIGLLHFGIWLRVHQNVRLEYRWHYFSSFFCFGVPSLIKFQQIGLDHRWVLLCLREVVLCWSYVRSLLRVYVSIFLFYSVPVFGVLCVFRPMHVLSGVFVGRSPCCPTFRSSVT